MPLLLILKSFFKEITGQFEGRSDLEQKKAVADYLQTILGYAMMGKVLLHIFVMFIGERGRNGKDTLLETLTSTVSSTFARGVTNDIVIKQRGNRAAGATQPQLMALKNVRAAWISETGDHDTFDVQEVKRLTGGGSIAARIFDGHGEGNIEIMIENQLSS